MSYPKPKPSAGLILGGLIAAAIGWATRSSGIDLGPVPLLLFWAGVVLVAIGVYRLAQAIDQAALHRWRGETAQHELELKAAVERLERGRAERRGAVDQP